MASPVGVWRLVEGQTARFLALRPNLRHPSYSMCIVLILQLLPQYKEMKGDKDVRGLSPQNLMVSSTYLINPFYSVVCMYSYIYFAGMYYNISIICLCWREVCRGSISCRHVEQQPQLTPTKQVFNKCLMRTWSLCNNNTSRLICGLAKKEYVAWTNMQPVSTIL